jgi:hypothetical protein
MSKLTKRISIPIIIVLITSILSVKAFFQPGLYTSHDGETHTARIANYYLALKEGQLPPSLAPSLFGGYGFPIFIFIYPLPYLAGAVLHSLHLTYVDAAKLVMGIGQVGSALLIYLFFKRETKKMIPSIVATFFFTWAPYRFLMLFVRGAYAESFAYLFVSATLLCLSYLIYQPNRRHITLTALALAGMLLSHQLVSVMFLPVFAFYVITKLILEPTTRKAIVPILLSLVLGFGLSAFIYLPAFFERKYLRFDELINYYQDHFVTIDQLIHSHWGYGFSHPGTINDDMSFQVGLTHILVVALSLLAIAWALIKKKFTSANKQIWYLLFWIIVFGLACFLMLDYPVVKWLWLHTPMLSTVDFPWRFLGVAVFAASMLSAYLLVKTRSNPILVILLVALVFYANRNHTRINEPVYYTDSYFDNYPATATWRNEFLPKTRTSNKWQGIEGPYNLTEGKANITIESNKTHDLELLVAANTPASVIVHRLAFPGWQIYLDGKSLANSGQLSVTHEIDLKTKIDYSGFYRIDMPSGNHQLSAKFLPTPLRALGYALSLISLLISALILLLPKIRK